MGLWVGANVQAWQVTVQTMKGAGAAVEQQTPTQALHRHVPEMHF
jgi:hypothetical protein